MKNPIITILVTLSFLLLALNTSAQNVGINDTGATPDPSAVLDLNSANKGFLITRADTLNIAAPAFGLMTLSPTDSCMYLFNGTSWKGMGGGGANCSCNCSTPGSPGGSTSLFPCNGTVIPIIEVTSPTGKIWMDRNLGATQVATGISDAAAYGDMYQWGRCSDGHEKRTSPTISTQSPTDLPGHGDFIIGQNEWRNPQNNNLWQSMAGPTNPCPTDYRLPTYTEYEAERVSWSSNNNAGAFASPLKLPATGARSWGSGSTSSVGSIGHYWSSTINGTSSHYLGFYGSGASMFSDPRGFGFTVRCIKD